MPIQKRQLGDIGEGYAVNFLKQKGYKILARNWRRHNCGEIDIVTAKTSGLLGKIKSVIFVEVKTIKGLGSNFEAAIAAQNVHYQKQQKLLKTAKIFLAQNKIAPDIPWQIDVIVVALNPDRGLVKIEHLENVVWGR
jgi:putative endonuclease